jgi:hypothetical protein
VHQKRLLLDTPDVVRTAVSPDYVSGWTMVHALREIIQEMVDARRKFGCRGGLKYSRRRMVAWDAGPGLKRSDLALGRSGKKGDEKLIGQFGEGLKLAALVAARNGREMVVETVGFTARPFIARDPALECEVLAFQLRPNSREKGTRITVGAAEEEFVEARSMFLELGPKPKRPAVFLPGGKIFVNGCLAAERGDLLFSYNLSDPAKPLQNRDRSALDEYALRPLVAQALGGLTNADFITALLRSVRGGQRYEHQVSFLPEKAVRTWRRSLREVFGPKACLADGTEADREAERMGYALIRRHPYSWESFFASFGIVHSSDLVRNRTACRAKAVKLDPRERRVLSWARRLVKRHLADPGKVKVAGELSMLCGRAASDALGLWDPAAGVIWVKREALSDPKTALGTLFHETLHKVSGATDCTANFEQAWEDLVVSLVMKRSRAPRVCA